LAEVDFTVAINAHSEGVVAGPTIASAEAAIAAAEAAGYTVERLIGLDSVTDECRDFFTQTGLSHWKSVELGVRDLGLARNCLAEAANGRWIAFLDADDLFSENWLTAGAKRLEQAEREGEDVVLHPELNMFFDAAVSVLGNLEQSSHLFTPVYWYAANYYDSLTMAPRRAFLEVPYTDRDRENGFAYEDWRWNLDTTDAGWRHVLVTDTIIFKRRRDMSLVIELGQNQATLWPLDALKIERMTPDMIPGAQD
jgi:hypothetical protein